MGCTVVLILVFSVVIVIFVVFVEGLERFAVFPVAGDLVFGSEGALGGVEGDVLDDSSGLCRGAGARLMLAI